MSAPRPIPKDTRENQRLASDPALSAWVSAHAGSGKTHVLSSRVVRLLLARTPPSRILCLTYTKAAAANMATRVFDILAKWALLDDDALKRAIESVGAPAPGQSDLVFARRLFARTVETPGGLKIQTIHAFCERILHLFPFEANVPASFRVIEDMERADLLERARRRTLASAIAEDGVLHEALECVARQTASAGFDDLIREMLGHRAALRDIADRENYAAELLSRLGLGEGDTLEAVEAEIIDGGIAHERWPKLAALLAQGGANDGKLADALLRAIARAPDPSCIEDYLDVFFTQKREPRGVGQNKIIAKALREKHPRLLAPLEEERDRLAPLLEKRKAAETFERSMALASIADAILSSYERMKSHRGLFDFDDLIERAQNLLRRCPSWALYKLDSAIDHILLDEAQDTSAAQWEILEAIADEFCAGAGARTIARTFFAVGDEKQSIFSFQGAAPEKFDAMRRNFQRRFTAAGQRFEPVRLSRSFRSAPQILEAVDMVFAAGDNRRGLSADPQEPAPRHLAWKEDVAGLIEIWDLVRADKAEAPTDWRLPLDYLADADPAARLAAKVARKIKSLLAVESGECVEDHGALRPAAPGDILILVRKRDAFFECVIRALKAEHVPVAGADRLRLNEHIAVMDLIALGRAALLREDDLTLASLLKSPLVGLSDDDLLAVAPGRAGSLFDALRGSPTPSHQTAARAIDQWTHEARALAPFDFYSRALGAGRGRERLVARLGPEANDAIDEFLRLALTFEREQAGGLAGFLASVETLDLSIKRDMEGAGAAVRVMTVHAAKGLEAKIVFLPDTCGAPSGRHDPKLFSLGGDDEPSLAWSTKMDADPPALILAREKRREAARDEHQRLLYVALTRAEERLYVAGYYGEKGPVSGCWYETIYGALEPECVASPDPDYPEKQILTRGASVARGAAARGASDVTREEIPEFARTPARKEAAPRPPLRPSNVLDGADVLAPFNDAASLTRRDSERLLIGRLTHALLQHLPQCTSERRFEAARSFLGLRAPQLDETRRETLARATIAIVEDARLAPLFGEASAAEVDIVARLATPRGELAIAGRIDRLADTEGEVFVADFKTGRPRAELGPEQLRQLALYRAAALPLYPGKSVRCVLIFTQDASVIEPSAEALDAALREIIETM
jgi:ATP-dependent helicase/nuclease subunit A